MQNEAEKRKARNRRKRQNKRTPKRYARMNKARAHSKATGCGRPDCCKSPNVPLLPLLQIKEPGA